MDTTTEAAGPTSDPLSGLLAKSPLAAGPLSTLFQPEVRADPYPYFEELLASTPVLQGEMGALVLSRHRHCLALLRHRGSSTDARTSAQFGPVVEERQAAMAASMGLEVDGDMRSFLFLDPPDHTRLRSLVSKAFTPKMIQGMEPRAQEIAGRLIDQALEAGGFDVVSGLAYPLPLQLISELLGVPEEARGQFREWSDALARGLDPEFLVPPDSLAERMAAVRGFVAYFRELIEERRRHPEHDLVSELASVEEAGERLSEGEMLATLILLLVAGHETTVNLIGNATLALTRDHGAQDAAREDPSLMRTMIEEVLRFDPPVQLTARFAREDLDLGDGVVVPEGGIAVALVPAANRDPAVFSEPGRFDATRSENPHLSFGFGIHHCLGAPLARLEARIALSTLLRRTRSIDRDGAPLIYKENFILRGLESLPVILDGA